MLLFDFLLISVIVLTAYLGPMVLRRLGPGQRLYGFLLLGDLLLAILALASRRNDGPNPAAGVMGAVAIGAAVCLVFAPPMLRNLSRRALAGDRLRLARWLMDLRELLQPGMGAQQESELISTIIEVKSGQVDAAIARLKERRERYDNPAVRRPIDERIVLTYVYARRWDDAALWFERHLGPGRASAQITVEMVRAYCERGQLDRAAALVLKLEGSREDAEPAEDPIWHLLVSRARLVFLAFVGRPMAVEAIVAPGGPLGAMPEASRLFWAGLAKFHAGDTSGARSQLERSIELSGTDGRARELAEVALRKVDEPRDVDREVSPLVEELADRLCTLTEDAPLGTGGPGHARGALGDAGTDEDRAGDTDRAAPGPGGGVDEGRGAGRAAQTRLRRPQAGGARPPRLQGVPLREVPVTCAIIVANIACALAVYGVWGSFADLGALVEAGANVKSATHGGEYWRLVSSMFLHVGLFHLGLNMYGLWVLGRLVEQFIGSARMLVVYMAAGLVGSVASLWLGGPSTSAGASGAVFGLLGAAAAELALHRSDYPKRWSGPLLGNLVFLAVANVAIGFFYPIIDQSAHIGGLVAGGLLGALLSRKLHIAGHRLMRGAVAVLVVASVAALVYGGLGVATSSYRQTLASYPRTAQVIGGLEVSVPVSWEKVSDTELYDPSLTVIVQLERLSGRATEADLLMLVDKKREAERTRGAKQVGFDRARDVESSWLKVPEGWRIRELEARVDAGVGGEQVYRAAVIARALENEVWIGSIYYPASMAAALSLTVSEILDGAVPIGDPPSE